MTETQFNAYSRTKSHIGFFDMSSRTGRVLAKGSDALDLLHRMSTNDLRPLIGKPGAGDLTVLTNEKGRIIDVINVLSRMHDALFITSAQKERAVVEWLDKFVIMEDASFQILTDAIQHFALFGPRSMHYLSQYVTADLIGLSPYHFVHGEIGGMPFTLQKTVRLAESGFSIYVDREIASELRLRLEAEVLEVGGAVLDDASFDLLRIEAGIPVTPNELNEKHNPLETTLVSAVSFTKGCYIGQEVIARLDSYDKVQRHMMGLVIDGVGADVLTELHNALAARAAVENDVTATAAERKASTSLPLELLDGSKEIGELTSYAFSPETQKVIGLGFVRSAHSNPGERLAVRLSESIRLEAHQVKLPFDV